MTRLIVSKKAFMDEKFVRLDLNWIEDLLQHVYNFICFQKQNQSLERYPCVATKFYIVMTPEQQWSVSIWF